MFKFTRNVLAAGIVSLGLVACGDDVTVVDPPLPPPPGVTSVTVAPANANITIGQNVVFAASVIADAGVSTAVTWTSSAPAIATVDGTGKVTGVAAGTTTIIAKSTADAGKTGVASVVVAALPAGIVSFGVSPTTVTVAPGQSFQASAQLVTAPGQTGTVVWSSLNPTIATVNSSTGAILGVATGSAVVRATATVGASTATADIGVTVRPIQAATLSIQSITAGLITLPVTLTNVFGQIEVNMNFNPGEQTVDSINVFIGNKRAAKASYVTNPAAGLISLSINTAEFTTPAASPTALVSYLNGPTGITAAVYPRNATSTATQATPIVLNNIDGWAATLTKPSVLTNDVNGFTYWGGPTANTSTQIWAVQYNAGRNGVETVSWTVGGCNAYTAGGVVGVQIATALTRTFGYTSNGAQTSCTSYEWTGGSRDNITVWGAIDGVNNNFPSSPLIANTVVFGATPDSLRLDYLIPSENALPSVAGAHGFSWVNAAWTFAGASASDFGVGMPSTPAYALFTTGANGSVTNGASASLNETNTNNITDGYRLYFTVSDRLGNKLTSSNTGYFGVDRTVPVIRYPVVGTLANVRTYGAGLDTATVVTAPAGGNPLTLWAAEALDNRSGLFDTPAAGATRGVDQGVKKLAPGAIGTQVAVAGDDNYGVTLLDGYRQTVPVPVWGSAGGQTNATAGYYTYTATIRDRAGNAVDLSNAAGGIAQRRYAIDPLPPTVTGLSMPFTFGANPLNLAGTFSFAASDDLEVIDSRLSYSFPNAVTGGVDQYIVIPGSLIADIGIKYDGTLAGALAVVGNLTTPVVSSVATPDFWAGMQILCPQGGACTSATDDGEPVVAGSTYQPDSVAAQASDVFGTNSLRTASAILAGSLPATTQLAANVYAGVNNDVQGNGIQVRYAPSVGATTIRQVSNFSVTLPQLDRLHAFRLIGTEWVYQGTATGTSGVGSDNGQERFWDYNFGAALTPAGTYAIVSVYNGPVVAARGTALWYQFVK